jgi:hypothetical protein
MASASVRCIDSSYQGLRQESRCAGCPALAGTFPRRRKRDWNFRAERSSRGTCGKVFVMKSTLLPAAPSGPS